jgi:hypothetical protein
VELKDGKIAFEFDAPAPAPSAGKPPTPEAAAEPQEPALAD